MVWMTYFTNLVFKSILHYFNYDKILGIWIANILPRWSIFAIFHSSFQFIVYIEFTQILHQVFVLISIWFPKFYVMI